MKAPDVPLDKLRISGLVFAPRPPRSPRAHVHHDTQRADVSHVATDDLSHTAHIRRALVDQIAGAQHKVMFCSFLFADDEIVRALCEAAERLRGGVYVLTSLDKHLRPEILELDAEIDATTAKQQDRDQRHAEHLEALAHAGVWLRSTDDCHAKFCVTDDARATVTSANATKEAYESNPEDGLAVHNAAVARELGRLFAHIWQHLSTRESTPGTRLDVHSHDAGRSPAWRALQDLPEIRPVATLRGEECSLRSAAVDLIDRATDHLSVATYSFIGMEQHAVGAALARALDRGVRLDLLVQPRNHVEAQRRSLAWLQRLAPALVRVHGHRRTHTKSIVADHQRVLLWTGNLEAQHGWDTGIEVGLVVDAPGVASAVAQWVADVMTRASHVALDEPSIAELVEAGLAPDHARALVAPPVRSPRNKKGKRR